MRETETFTSRLAYLVQTRSENASLKVSLLLYIHDIPSVCSSGIQLCVGYWIYIIQIKFHVHKLCNVQHTHKITAQSFFLIIKPTRCTNFTNLFCHETLHVSDSSSVHHQEFIHCTPTNGICHTGLQTAFEQDCRLQTGMTYIIAESTVNKLLMMDRRTVRNMLTFMPK